MEWLKSLIEKNMKDGVLDTEGLMTEVTTEFPKYAVPKSEFNTLNETKKDLEKQIKERDSQLGELNKKVQGNEELEKTIKELQTANENTKAEYETKLKEAKVDSAIQAKLTDTKYADLLTGKFDRSKLSVSEDGTVLGIDEQLATIKETYKDLFTVDLKGKLPNNTGGSQVKGKRQELEAIINDPNTKFVDRVAAKNQLFNLESEE